MWKDAFIAIDQENGQTLAIGAIHVDTRGEKSLYLPATKTRLPYTNGNISSTIAAYLNLPNSKVRVHL